MFLPRIAAEKFKCKLWISEKSETIFMKYALIFKYIKSNLLASI